MKHERRIRADQEINTRVVNFRRIEKKAIHRIARKQSSQRRDWIGVRRHVHDQVAIALKKPRAETRDDLIDIWVEFKIWLCA